MRQLSRGRDDAALLLACDLPDPAAARGLFDGLPVHFLPAPRDDAGAARLLADCDVLLDPAADDLTGRRVVEAQAAGVPVLVARGGAGAEVTDDDVTGLTLPAADPAAWAAAITALLDDEPRRLRMGRNGPQRAARFARGDGRGDAFDVYWNALLAAALAAWDEGDEAGGAVKPPPAAGRAGSSPARGGVAPAALEGVTP